VIVGIYRKLAFLVSHVRVFARLIRRKGRFLWVIVGIYRKRAFSSISRSCICTPHQRRRAAPMGDCWDIQEACTLHYLTFVYLRASSEAEGGSCG